jgi:aldose 1-epimerase
MEKQMMIKKHLVALCFCLPLILPNLLNADEIKKSDFGTTADGQSVQQFTLTNSKGASLGLITYGATVTSLIVPDKNGNMGDVVLGFDNIADYENKSPYFGAIIGRVGNRIAKGMFQIDGARYCVPVNNGANSLHGGFRGFDKRVWSADAAMTADGPSVRFQLVDPDGTEGFPGTLKVTVIYSLTDTNAVKIQYFATTDRTTPVNLTNHTYWNLKDGGQSDIFGHVLRIYGDHYTPVDATLIPTGEIASVSGTPIDFTSPKPIGKDLKSMGGDPTGYDHNLALTNQDGSFAKAVDVYEPESGRWMQVWTTEPGVQFYSGNFLDGSYKGKKGTVYNQYGALVLECQHYPDSVNHANFPSTLLHPGDVYRQITEYRFSTVASQPF